MARQRITFRAHDRYPKFLDTGAQPLKAFLKTRLIDETVWEPISHRKPLESHFLRSKPRKYSSLCVE